MNMVLVIAARVRDFGLYYSSRAPVLYFVFRRGCSYRPVVSIEDPPSNQCSFYPSETCIGVTGCEFPTQFQAPKFNLTPSEQSLKNKTALYTV